MKKNLLSLLFISISFITFSQITITSTVTNVSCFGGTNGAIVISVSGGTAPYTYSWTPTLPSSTNITNLSAGTYSLIVLDAVANTSTLSVTITEPPQLTAVTSSTNSNCGQSNGAVCASVSGGTSPHNYIWSFGSTILCGNNIPAGAYTFTVTDMNACTAVSNGFVNNIAGPVASITTPTNATCGQADGELCGIASGGSAPYIYSWSNGATAICNTNIPAGTYSFSVTDAFGCIGFVTGQVNNSGAPIITIASQTNVSCFSGNNGAATTSVTGGTSPYIYAWTAGGGTFSAVSNLVAGMYGVTVTDASGCIGTQTVLITQPSQLNLNFNNIIQTCSGACNGSASALVSGGTPIYSYSWNTAPISNTPIVTNLCPGFWLCTITDANGCIATSTVNVGSIQTFSTNINQIIGTCGATCNGAAAINIIGGNAPFTFSSTGPVNISNSNPTNLCIGIYTVTTTDNSGCSFTNMLNINSIASNTITNVTAITTSYDETCLQTNDGAIDLTITGSNPGPFTYQWNTGATTQDLNNISSNNYYVIILEGSSNCLVLRDTVNAVGTNCGSIAGNVFFDNNSDCIKNVGDNNFINAQIIINPGNKIGYTNVNGDYMINNLPFGTYSITSSITNTIYIATCSASLSATINSITPNVINKNFAREYSPLAQPDLYVSAYSNGIVPGFVCRANYALHNYNTFNANGVFKVTLPSAFIPNITNAFPATYTLSGDTVIWNFTNINYVGWNYNFYIDFTTPLTTPLGSVFTTCMWAQPTVTDLNYANNTYCYSRYVTGSFDPNDKTVNPLGVGPNGDIAATETDLTYLIRFQNTGNGPAVNIVVKDTLSPNVDVNTFEMLGASHNYNIDILPGNVLRWKFNNIMLADSGSNEPASHGYIQYRIKRTNNNAPGTQIKNTAYIYFDFNEPVVTNTAINTIETITGIKSTSSNNDEWNVYPNPSTGVLYIVNSSSIKEASQIQVINSIGQTVLEETINNNFKNIDLSKLNNGVYFVKITSDKSSTVKRIVLSK